MLGYDNDWVLFGYIKVPKTNKIQVQQKSQSIFLLPIYIYIYITVEMDRITSTEVVSDFRRYVYTFFLLELNPNSVHIQLEDR